MPWYVPVPTPSSLDAFLACSWTAVPTGRHRLVPDACIDLVWISTGELWVCGPETTAWDFALPPGTVSAGVRFRPGVGPALLGSSAAVLADVRTALVDLVPAPLEARLRNELACAGSLDGRRGALEDFAARLVRHRTAVARDNLRFSDSVLDLLAATPRATATMLARHLDMNVRQLHRRSLVSFGYGTSMLARLLRFQRFLALHEGCAGSPHRLAMLAIEAGYSDQAHLTRDCRAITGHTPSRFMADYFPTFPDMTDPFKTAAPLAAPAQLAG